MKIVNGIAVIEGDTHISKWVEQSRRLDHDHNMLPLVLRHIVPSTVVIDIGAYIGDHTIAYVNAGAVVYAFEPNPEAFECLRYNLGGAANLYNIGLSDHDGEMAFLSPNENKGMGFLSEGNGVTVTTLDRQDLTPSFIKIDVEGMEINVLRGAENTIKAYRPVMLIEINRPALERNNSSAEEIFEWLKNHHYSFENIYPGQSLDELQLDIICKPELY